ncbi:MAG TPA: phage major capsid protein [Pseudomonas xinjiangensis]|uniref:Phage major capsid protein n=2 Tax=root TaxID=1 RepID=A0A7V1FQI2_9GAMM|nr:phage major capsid protein [Halopseudomonas xinjiangensis]HEC47160.1 phage major capsid protein [Halopseudomonas xinjiangensis]
MNRAYSVLNVKEVDGEQRIIRGIASTPSPDRMGDVVEPLGAKFKTPMPLLWQHQHDKPVGLVEFAAPTKEGIPFEARLPAIAEPGALKDRVDEAWQSVKSGLVTAVSIGFKAIADKAERLESGGLRFKEWEWLELSLVTIPANAEATITQIKAIDNELLAASGRSKSTRSDSSAGASAVTRKTTPPKPEEGRPMNIAEQIKSFENKRAASAARLESIMAKAADDGRTLDEIETEEYEGLETEVVAVDKHLVRLRGLEKTQAIKAKPIEGEKVNSFEKGAEFRDNAVIRVERNLPKGTAFTRYAIALARSKGNLMQAAEIAKSWHDSTPEVETVLKAAIAAGTTTDSAWAAPLVEYQNMASEFIELLRPQTIIGRMQGMRNVPFNIKMPGQTSGSSTGWVGQGKSTSVSKLAFDTTTLRHTKCAGIVVLTDELVRFSNPSAEAIVQADLAASIAQFLDESFIDPTRAEVADVSPASITNGVTPIIASGTTVDALKADVKALFTAFIAANLTPAGGVWVMTPTIALTFSMMQNALGQPEFPGIDMNGGTFFGLPVIVSESVPANAGVGTEGARIVLVKTSEILLADDGGVTLDVSREASLQMDSAPADGATALVSLWQNHMVALRAERYINWKRRRPQAVGYIDSANYQA